MRNLKILAFMFALTFIAFSCKNDDDDNEVLSIVDFTPKTATAGTEITIVGTKFSATASENIVKFGNVEAAIKSASTNQIVAIVPSNATTGKISVTVNGQTVSSSSDFTLSNRSIVEISGEIKSSRTWSSDSIYLLKGFVYVTDGVTLTIEPGTLIKGDKESKGALVIEKGAKLMAEGTAQNPIVFTSNQAKGSRSYGDWGGVVLMGKAPHNRLATQTFEGGLRGTYGAFNVADDNSGSLKYVRIEFAGIALTASANSEVNGLTLYSVGSGTTLEHIQVSYSGDDSYEWFGGTVTAKYLVAYRGFDDDFDTDFGFSGKVQYGVSLRDPNIADQSGSNGFESDNFGNSGTPATDQNNGLPLTSPVFANISVFGTSGTPSSAATPAPGSGPYQSAMHLRRNTSISIFNSVFVGYPEGLRLDNNDVDTTVQTVGTSTYANAVSGNLQLRGIVLANVTNALLGKGKVTNDQASKVFNMTGNNNLVATTLSELSLNAANFTLGTPNFLPASGSPLLQNAVWTGKGDNSFFTKETFRGAFGTVDWTAGWTNFDPQNTDYK
ncbi:IPT/TIG domain-containing protein [Xanthocytophaga agilis]|uniref:IPT/TIG domain-containing protein n=1 Tax=Xanthocytophaga agilis TaxID=3048010 RepID=A0AAE3UGK3_9BACT|nr:IPT/TIG domain-containing protein [Xanthocytophaga agilis]MDJ1503386.1 IPT/TIG domain-containing protein [Xanthocytophaga agilis]